MKRPNKKLLNDLLEDSASAEFRSQLMDKTLRNARQRRRLRHFSYALGIIALMGIPAIMFQEMRPPTVSSAQLRSETLHPTPSQQQPSNPTPVIITKPDATLVVVQTTESDRPREISDQELVAMLSNQPVALVRYASGRVELVSLNQEH